MLPAVLQASLGENSRVGFCTPPYLNRRQPRGMGSIVRSLPHGVDANIHTKNAAPAE